MSLNGKGINETNELDCLRALVQGQSADSPGGGNATAGNQLTEIARLDSILAKVIVAPATEAKQDIGNTSLGVMDDWDESDRAKVNPIAGQAGVAAGHGATSASTQRVIAAALDYSVVAAGQTNDVLGTTGAAGDYLSHVVLQPVTTGAGTTTIIDNSTVIFTYTAGTLADLRPIIVPVGCLSTGGAWKITTGANMTATGFGKFT